VRRLAALLLVLAACAPGLTPGRIGFVNARGPSFGSVAIEPNPSFFGEPADAVAGWWNVAAGRPLLVISAAPQIAFRVQTPIVAAAEQDLGGGPRIVARAEQRRNPDGSMGSCTVYYDPTFVAYGVPGRHLSTFVLAHEVGHCLELLGHDQRDSVMGLTRFWEKAIANYGPVAADTAQLRAAGYIP
jgi:hypothetical protein